ncbi:MAG: arginyltransferase [Gammaproteobacteria bacterium]
MNAIPLFLTQEHDCNYLDDRTARSAFVHPSFPLSTSAYSQLIQHGFRRSGDHVYRTQCPHCSSCIPLRIPVLKFKPSRIQRRTMEKNRSMETTVKPPVFEQKHFELYRRYQKTRHPGGSMANPTAEDYMNFLSSRWCDTLFIEMVMDDELAAVAVVDRLENALSAVYTFFEPKFSSFSPGAYAVLWQIEYAKRQRMEWLYLGFWIESCHKMAYKNQYRPLQALIGNRWKTFYKDQPITD